MDGGETGGGVEMDGGGGDVEMDGEGRRGGDYIVNTRQNWRHSTGHKEDKKLAATDPVCSPRLLSANALFVYTTLYATVYPTVEFTLLQSPLVGDAPQRTMLVSQHHDCSRLNINYYRGHHFNGSNSHSATFVSRPVIVEFKKPVFDLNIQYCMQKRYGC